MHKNFYASGFIYNPASKQILLQQSISTTTASSSWSMFEDIDLTKESAEATFQQVIQRSLHLKLSLKNIRLVYTYVHPEKNRNYSIVYAETDEAKTFSPRNGMTFSWFSFKQAFKLPLTAQTKHDITVGQRVIDSKIRKDLGQQTLE